MPRSTKKKSSKHGSREYSDSERDSKSQRKLDSKEVAGNREYSGEYGSLKRRKERGDGGGDERGSKSRRRDGRRERSVDDEEERMSKEGYENSDSRKLEELQSPELDNQLERRMRKKRDSGDKHLDDVGDGYDRRLSSRYRDKYREEMDKENKHRHDTQRDEHPANDHTSIKSNDKHGREEKDSLESREKRTKLLENDCDQYQDHNRDQNGDQDHDLKSGHDHEQHEDNKHVHDCYYYDFDRDRDYDRGRDYVRDRDSVRDRYWDRDRDCGHGRHHDRDVSHVDDRSSRRKESGTKKRTLDDCDDYPDTKSRFIKGQHPDGEKRSLSNSRADSDVDRGRSQPRLAYLDSSGTSNKHRSSPAPNIYIGKDEYRNANSEDPFYRDSMIEQRTKGSREGYSGISERGPKYESTEKTIKIDDGPVGDLSIERSSSAKAATMGLAERSPSTGIERRYMNNARDFSTSDGRIGRDLNLEKPLSDEPPQAESSFYVRTSQGIASLVPPPPAFRAALNRPFMGSFEHDVRENSGTRYRSSDPGFGRGHGNSWRAFPNWTSPVPNGFVSFQPGPAHGGFQPMMPQFASQPLFGIRPSMEVNHAGIPYHMTDAERFQGHLRPIGWQNVMDGTGPAHLQGWESNNGVFRNDPHIYGGSDWDRTRHSTNSRRWESGSENWKEQNGDSKKDLPSLAGKDESVPAQLDDNLTGQTIQVSRDDGLSKDEFHEKSSETKSSSLISSAKVPFNSLPTTVPAPSDNTTLLSQFYLSRLDISADLVIPELYDQCMCVVNASIVADASMKLFQKNSSTERKKYAAILSRNLPFPAIDDCIFQKAIELYKKQRVELPNGGKVDVISGSNQVQVDETAPIPSSENRQVSALVSDGTDDLPMSTLEQEKPEKNSPAKEHLEEIDQTCGLEEPDHETHLPKLLMSSPSSGHEKQSKHVAGLCEKEDEVSFDKVNLGDAEENNPMTFKNESHLAPTLPNDGDNFNSKTTSAGFAHRADEKLGLGDKMVCPLIFEDGSPRACDALMPGSNESESLMLSRIHHSPESTH